MSAVMKQRAWLALVAVLCVLSALLTPQSAEATGLPVTFNHDSAQAGDAIVVSSEMPCMPPPGGSYAVEATIKDSTNATFSGIKVVPKQLGDGTWESSILSIPLTVALGSATVTLRCRTYLGLFPSLTTDYDPAPLTIVGHSSDITVDKTNLWSTATFDSVTPCPADSVVDLDIRSRKTYDDATTLRSVTEISSQVDTDAQGNWTYVVDVYPGNGFINYPEYALPTAPVVPNEIYTLWAHCVTAGADYDYGSFSFEVFKDEYVALGDSFSAGTGTFNYDLAGTGCFRSTDSYPHYLVEQLGLGRPNFGACHGAVTDDFFTSVGEPAQTHRLSYDTKYVTLTIGGNDAGFADVIKRCSDPAFNAGYDCSTNPTVAGPVDDRLLALQNIGVTEYVDDGSSTPREIHTIQETLEAIATAAPSAKIYIAGYPRLFGASNTNYSYKEGAPGSYECSVYEGPAGDRAISFSDAQWMNDKADELNEIIDTAVDFLKTEDVDVTYVPPTTFDGHGLCDSDTPYINPIDIAIPNLIGAPESMHPTVDGYLYGYGVAFEAKMN
jgi:hypothetical protein